MIGIILKQAPGIFCVTQYSVVRFWKDGLLKATKCGTRSSFLFYSVGWITGQNDQRLQIFAILASFLWGNLKQTFLEPLILAWPGYRECNSWIYSHWNYLSECSLALPCLWLTHLCPQVRFCTFFRKKIKSRPILTIRASQTPVVALNLLPRSEFPQGLAVSGTKQVASFFGECTNTFNLVWLSAWTDTHPSNIPDWSDQFVCLYLFTLGPGWVGCLSKWSSLFICVEETFWLAYYRESGESCLCCASVYHDMTTFLINLSVWLEKILYSLLILSSYKNGGKFQYRLSRTTSLGAPSHGGLRTWVEGSQARRNRALAGANLYTDYILTSNMKLPTNNA